MYKLYMEGKGERFPPACPLTAALTVLLTVPLTVPLISVGLTPSGRLDNAAAAINSLICCRVGFSCFSTLFTLSVLLTVPSTVPLDFRALLPIYAE